MLENTEKAVRIVTSIYGFHVSNLDPETGYRDWTSVVFLSFSLEISGLYVKFGHDPSCHINFPLVI